MSGREYWKKRFKEIEDKAYKMSRKFVNGELDDIFGTALSEIEKDIAVWYERFADNNGITMAEAKRAIQAKELKELNWSVEEYIKKGTDNAQNHLWEKELENASAKYHISRLEALKLQVQQSCEVMFGNMTDGLDKLLQNVYKEGYYRTAYEVQSGLKAYFDTAKIDDDLLKTLLSKPWADDGSDFSERIWGKYRPTLVNKLHKHLSECVMRGENPKKVVKLLTDDVNVARKAANRLVFTEYSYFNALSVQNSFDDLGVEEFEVCETLDSKTCDTCADMDGEHYPMSEYDIGLNAPPFHPFCRGTVIPYFDDKSGARAARDEEGKTYYTEDMTYNEWKEKFVDKPSEEDYNESEISYSELGRFRENVLRPDNRMTKEYYTAVKEKFSHGSDSAKAVFNKYVSQNAVADAEYPDNPKYNTADKKIYMNYAMDLQGSRGTAVTWFHEHGHMVDDMAGVVSKDTEFLRLLVNDSNQYLKSIKNKNNLKTQSEIYDYVSKSLDDMKKYSAISDILGALTGGEIKGVAGHRQEYWDNKDNITSEAFAHMFEAQFDDVRYQEIKKVFPNSLKYFENKLREIL